MENDYYTNAGEKVTDFCLGFFGQIAYYIFAVFFISFFGSNGFFIAIFSTIFIWILYAIPIICLIFAIKYNRRFIAIGMIIAWTIPFILFVLLFGACLLGGFGLIG